MILKKNTLNSIYICALFVYQFPFTHSRLLCYILLSYCAELDWTLYLIKWIWIQVFLKTFDHCNEIGQNWPFALYLHKYKKMYPSGCRDSYIMWRDTILILWFILCQLTIRWANVTVLFFYLSLLGYVEKSYMSDSSINTLQVTCSYWGVKDRSYHLPNSQTSFIFIPFCDNQMCLLLWPLWHLALETQ